MSKSTFKQILQKKFIRFLLVGGLNMTFGYAVFALLIFLGFHYSLAVFIGTILGIVFNFQTVGRIVFGSHDSKLIGKFFVVYGVTYFLNVAGIYSLRLIGMNNYIAGALLILPVALVAFYLNQKFVFTERESYGPDAKN